jgi:hypothetical protein
LNHLYEQLNPVASGHAIDRVVMRRRDERSATFL